MEWSIVVAAASEVQNLLGESLLYRRVESPGASELWEPQKFTVSKLRKTEPRDFCFDVLWIASLGLSISPVRGDPMCSLSATNLVVTALVDGLGVRGEDPELDLLGCGSFVT